MMPHSFSGWLQQRLHGRAHLFSSGHFINFCLDFLRSKRGDSIASLEFILISVTAFVRNEIGYQTTCVEAIASEAAPDLASRLLGVRGLRG